MAGMRADRLAVVAIGARSMGLTSSKYRKAESAGNSGEPLFMDKQEAASLLAEHLSVYRGRTYADLTATMGNLGCVEVAGPSGVKYQIEVDVLWDDEPGGNVRVMAGIDDGSFRAAFSPLTDSFIKMPDGAFVGED
jgi:hypothetical protein